MAELQAGLEDALAGRGRLFLLVGEPGIGKTRLADEFATFAWRQGARVLWGRCWEGEGGRMAARLPSRRPLLSPKPRASS